MTQNPRNPNPIENDDEEDIGFESQQQNQPIDDVVFGRADRKASPLSGDDPVDLEEAVAALDEDEPEELGTGEDHERVPDRTQQRGYR